MGEAKRRKLAGNTQPNPEWRRKLTKAEVREAVRVGVIAASSDLMFMYRDMLKGMK